MQHNSVESNAGARMNAGTTRKLIRQKDQRRTNDEPTTNRRRRTPERLTTDKNRRTDTYESTDQRLGRSTKRPTYDLVDHRTDASD
nr:MAG: hypothetical protein [Apis mellifera filamentous virus]